MEFASVFQSIFMMGSMIGIGSLLAKHAPLNDDTRNLMIQLIVNVAMPCIILNSIFQFPINQQVLKQVLMIFFLSIALNILGIGLGWILALISKAPPNKAREMAILSGLGNTGFIGLPLCAVLFGPKGALLAAVFDAGLDFTLWTVGIIFLQRDKNFSLGSMKAMLNLPMAAIILGLATAALNFHPPAIVVDMTEKLANLASPLAMMYIGMLFPSLLKKKGQISLPQLGLPIVCKLILFPILTAFIFQSVSLDLEITQVILVQSTMPTITLASILFAKCAADEEMGAAATVFSTLVSLTTIPFMVYLLSHWI